MPNFVVVANVVFRICTCLDLHNNLTVHIGIAVVDLSLEVAIVGLASREGYFSIREPS